MNKIKSFIYLDNYKMYSISSQLFSGLTEYFVKSEKSAETKKDEQKGIIGSGRLMADIIETESQHTEKKFLHDYAYTLFEEKLLSDGRVLQIDTQNISENVEELENYSFIKITNKIGFNDTQYVQDTMEKFNSLGEALTVITAGDALSSLSDSINHTINSSKDRNVKNKANIAKQSSKAVLTKLAKESGLHMDPKFLEALCFILNYGYNGSFEVQIPFVTDDNYYLFSSLLNRELLTEKELNIIKKYSRETEKEFTVFGILTQVRKGDEKTSIYQNAIDSVQDEERKSNMKESVMNIIASLTRVEETFTGKLDYEYIIDPIAIYREI